MRLVMINKVCSRQLSLKDIFDDKLSFIIPAYQRPYVWGDENISRLFEDIYNACKDDRPYFLGTIVTSSGENDTVKVLIDGQQRFTTLILLSIIFKIEGVSDLNKFLCFNDELRLGFSIRSQVRNYLNYVIKNEKLESEESVKEDEYTKNIYNALNKLHDLVREKSKSDACDLAAFVYEKVSLVENLIPSGMNPTQIFIDMATTGVQLQKTDILKELLLKKVSNKKAYKTLWEWIESMDTYVDRYVPKEERKDILFFNFISKYNDTVNGSDLNSLTIFEIIKDRGKIKSTDDDEKITFNISVKPIINFAQLLLHGLRIFCSKKGLPDIKKPLHSDNLIDIFNCYEFMNNSSEVEKFLGLLWKIRILFDRYVVKWSKTEDESHLITVANNNEELSEENSDDTEGLMNPRRKSSSVCMLQSVLYFTSERASQYWLTSYLAKLYDFHDKNQSIWLKDEENLNILESIDNELSLGEDSVKECSFYLCNNNKLERKRNICSIIDQDFYTINKDNWSSIKRYWFQKLEYILWKSMNNSENMKKDPKFDRYRIISRNSIEHIFPQNEAYGNSIGDHCLHNFGNFVYLTVGQNSSYGNKTLDAKKQHFKDKPVYESLKLKEFFDGYESDSDQDYKEKYVLEHRTKMLKLIAEHYCQSKCDFDGSVTLA